MYEVLPLWNNDWCEPMKDGSYCFPRLLHSSVKKYPCLAADHHAAVIYCSAQLLAPDIRDNIVSQCHAYEAAIALCLMTTVYEEICSQDWSLIKRSLLWAGLVLTGSIYTTGTSNFSYWMYEHLVNRWIRSVLKACIDRQSPWDSERYETKYLILLSRRQRIVSHSMIFGD